MEHRRGWLGFGWAFVVTGLFASACSSGPVATDDAGFDGQAGDGGLADVVGLPDVVAVLEAGSDTAALDAADDGDANAHVCPTTAPLDCSPGSGTGEADQCFGGPSCYVTKVQKAVNDVVAANPSWFDFNNQYNCPLILDVDSYMNAVVAELAGPTLCAIRDPNAPGEEVTLKHDNAFTENFDIVASTGCARSGSAIYTGWCAPAWW